MVDPLINYLHDRINDGNNVMYIIEKYKKRTEWFDKAKILDTLNADTQKSEAIVDQNFRQYLFDQGIDYPFSAPKSPSGEADVVADIGEDKPLVLEIKLFDLERGYDRAYIRKGFRQIHDYMNDYSQSVGYLVIFNCTPKSIVFNTKIKGEKWPPRITIDHRTIFLIVIDLHTPKTCK
jgi:hypothetical protein